MKNTLNGVARAATIMMFVGVTELAVAQRQPAPVDQARLAEYLVKGNPAQRSAVLAAVERIAPERIGPELRTALVGTLRAEGATQARNFESRRLGRGVQESMDPEVFAELARAVARLRDRGHIAPLAGVLSTGVWVSEVDDALSGFGDDAVPTLVGIVRSNPSSWAIQNGLMILRQMVDTTATRALSPASRASIASVAKLRLTQPAELAESGVTLRIAMEVAVGLGDTELTGIVRELATNRSAVVAQGITDEEGIKVTQKAAVDRLARRASGRK